MEKEFQVGVITTTHGVRGEVKVFPTTDDPGRFEKLKNLTLRTPSGDILLQTEKVRYFKQYVILKFKGIDNINDIEKYKGMPLFVDREHASPLSADEYYIPDLMGCRVYAVDEDGRREEFGVLRDVMETGANDVYIVDSIRHGEVLLPAIHDCIKHVDVENGEIDVFLMEGLIG